MRSPIRTSLISAVVLVVATVSPAAAGGTRHTHHPPGTTPTLLASGLGSGSGSTIGPDGALYVAQPAEGAITRIDPRTGATTPFASGLPTRRPGFPVGGVTDVAFLGHKAYALVSVVGTDVGGTSPTGIYRLHRNGTATLVADIGTWAIAHPPETDFFVPSGVQYAMQPWHGGFLVTDGHHNRVLKVSTHGTVREVIAFGNTVPTGIDVARHRVYLAEAGPVPHDPATGRVVTFRPGATEADEVASGTPILTDVELGDGGGGRHGHGAKRHGHHGHHGATVYAVSNGTYSGDPEGSPGLPDTGSLVKADRHGGFRTVADGLDRPTSLEIVHHTAYVVTYDGEVWTVRLGH